MYHHIWDALIREEQPCEWEADNYADPFAVAVVQRKNIVGHVPRKISTICSLLLRRGGSTTCVVTGSRHIREIYHKEELKYPASWFFVENRSM